MQENVNSNSLQGVRSGGGGGILVDLLETHLLAMSTVTAIEVLRFASQTSPKTCCEKCCWLASLQLLLFWIHLSIQGHSLPGLLLANDCTQQWYWISGT